MDLYFFTTLLSGIIGLTLAVLLSGLQIRSGEGLQKYNRARWCLVGAFSVFGLLNLAEASLDGTGGGDTGAYAGCLAIVIGSLLSMLFTMTVLSFVRPKLVSRRQILVQLAVILPPCLLLILLRIFAPEPVYNACFGVMLAAYLLLMVLYTRLFVKSYRAFKAQMLAFYEEEDLVGQLQWINWTFWLALGIGIAALLFLADSPVAGSILNVVFTAGFLFICIFFVNYRPYAVLVNRAVEEHPKEKGTGGNTGPSLDTSEIQGHIDQWIRQKGYLDNTRSVEETAYAMGLYYPALKEYIQSTQGEDFRSWRIRLRIQEAERILAGQPDLPVSQVATKAGFNDRAFFYRSFQKVTGRSVREYLDALRRGDPIST